MKSIGSTFLFFAVGSIVLGFFNYDFIIVSWVDSWGETTGWAIRGAAIVVGAGLFFLGWRAEQEPSPAAAEAQRQEPTMQAASAPAAQPAAQPAAGPTDEEPGTDPMGSLHNH